MEQDQQSHPLTQKATGPRTFSGKKRSRRNALSHGVCARQLLLNGERPEDFSSLYRDLQEDLCAEGALEELLVLQLAMLFWRKWRLLKAETAEIAKASAFLKSDHVTLQRALVSGGTDGLVVQHSNPVALQCVVELLSELRDGFEHRGLNLEEDVAILRKIYGCGHLEEGFPFDYLLLTKPVQDTNKLREASRKTIKLIDQELARFKSVKSEIEQAESSRSVYAELTSLVPEHDVQERLLRHESHLNREIDRVLGQLEHVRRLRVGLLCPATIKVTRA